MNEVNMDEINKQIDEWVEKKKKLTGTEVRERETWNYDVTPDTIRHFCYGTDDDNPLYIDPDYAAKTKYGKLIAPPGYLVSVLYPILHGEPMKAPLASLIGGVAYEWNRPIYVGDKLHAVSKQDKFFEKVNKQGRRLNFVISDISYLDKKDELVGKATGTMIMATFALTALALGFGALFPNYESDNMAEIPTSFGGLLFMMAAVGYLAGVIILEAWPVYFFLSANLRGELARNFPVLPLVLGIAGAATLTVIAIVLPLRAGVRRVRALDFQ